MNGALPGDLNRQQLINSPSTSGILAMKKEKWEFLLNLKKTMKNQQQVGF